jgi:hypothetical protein
MSSCWPVLLVCFLLQLSMLGTLILHIIWLVAPPSSRYPDLLTMMFVIYAAAHFVIFYIIILVNQWAIPVQATEDEDLQVTKEVKAAGKRAKKLI